MKRVLPLVAALAALTACGESSSPTGDGLDPDSAGPAAVEVVDAIRGRQGTASWFITPDMRNNGGPGSFYIHVEGEAVGLDGPRAQCGLTQTIDVGAGWRDTLDFVFECERAPQYLTVYTRPQGVDTFSVSDTWVY